MADNGTVGRVHTMMCPKPTPETPPKPPKADSLGGQIYNESASVVGGAWDGLKQTATTLKEASGLGVSDCVASAARDRIVDGMGDAVKGLATLAGPGEASQWAYVSGNPDAIAAVDAAYAAQFQAFGGIADHVKAAVSSAYARNGTAGAASMMLTTLGVEVLGSKGSGAVLSAAGKAAEIVRLAKTPTEAAAALTREAAAAKLAGRSAKEIEVLEKAAAEREAAAKAAAGAEPKEGVAVKRKTMKEHKPKCFKPGEQLKKNWMGSAKDLEKGFYKQLKDQEAGLNKMSVGQYLENRAQYDAIGRTGEAAQGAMRAAMEKRIRESMVTSLSKSMGIADAAALAAQGAKEAMGSLAALHGPDLVAGGSGALTGLGDAGINSSLGGQWSGKVGKMDTAAIDAMHANGPDTPMNVTLERCP